jgi:uncharacterized iron-regulated membrane protein
LFQLGRRFRSALWRAITLRLPTRADGPLQFSISDARHWNRFARSQLTIDGGTGEVVRGEPYVGMTAGQKARGWLRFAHTGELGGLPGQLIAGVACVGGVVLVWTGLALAWRRLLAFSPRPEREAVSYTTKSQDLSVTVHRRCCYHPACAHCPSFSSAW